MPEPSEAAAARAFITLAGAHRWRRRQAEIARLAEAGPRAGRSLRQHHVVERTLARLARGTAPASPAETAIAALSIDPSYTTGPIVIAGNGGTYPLPTPITKTGSGTLTGPTSAFVGAGIQTIDTTTITFDGFTGGGGNNTTSITTVGNATLNVTYAYSPNVPQIPEPFTAALLGSGVVFLGLIRRRRG